MVEKLINRRVAIMGITLIVDMDSEGKEVYSVLAHGFDNGDIVIPIPTFELAVEAARAAEAVWTKEADPGSFREQPEPEGKVA
ncbi:hypothetical protein [Xylophilus sp.]|uniref:hypothetical protein n=1 Tax=Xylophilus sp. TaxID=2653893 RepID=UPI0013BC6606|nr:hypothetical protein [Xylophilus sp.]KAF1045636.1 MAG: hypothetical protein GAK38_02928 [Xylophilus sp.]